MWIFFCIFVIMNDEVENTNPCREIDFRNIHNALYGFYGVNTPYTSDDERWYNWLHKRQLLTNSVRNLNKCGIEVEYSNRNKIVHEQK